MKHCCYVAGRLAALGLFSILFLAGQPGVLAQSSNGVLREVYSGIAGGAVSDLTSHPSFPCCPTLETIQPTFEAPTEFAENYGQRMRALLIAPQTGNYTFWVASDDGGALFLSTTDNPAQRVQIATVNAWTSSREWTKEPNQQSATNIALVAGQKYYIEALQKEGGGGDNLAVRWRLPSGVIEEPIPNSRLLVYGLGPPVVAVQPANVTVVEAGSASFTVQLQRNIGSVFQWKRNGTNIPNATNSSYPLGPLILADSASSFFCSITNSLGGTNSTTATLTVVPDTTRPTINTVGNLGENDIVFVVFSEAVEEVSAINPANYTVSGGINVTAAAFGVDARTIILTTTPMAPNVTYTLTVNNIRDRATAPNTILPGTQRTFSVTTRPLDIGLLSLPKEPLGPTSRRHGVVISEVMYHPTNRFDGRNVEFIEIYNAQPWFEELGGWRVTGAIDYVFPSNTVLASRSFLVVAANPADFRAVYPFTNVFGPFLGSNGLQNSSGTLRLRNERDAVVFEMNYSGDAPFPVAADGSGHSLVLARASYGEGDPRAWEASAQTGGTPGTGDVFNLNSLRTVLINEFLAHTDPPSVDFIELFNYGNFSVNLAGCILTDDPSSNKFVIPASTVIPARGFMTFTEAQLGFSLSSSGESLLLKHPSGRTVIDGVRFGAQENGVATGRFPDGAARFTRLSAPTPGTNNAPFKAARVVINEIMFDPIRDDADDEYLELRNLHTNAVNVGGWRIRDAVTFNLPTNTFIAAGGYLVIAKHAAHLRTNYPGLTLENTLGDYGGTLANGGERIELTMPHEQVNTNAIGQFRTNLIHVTVDEATYGPGGRWGRYAHGGGSSLELRDARADRRLAPNWAESDDSGKSPWVTVAATGVMDNGYADANQLHITLLGAGEALIDNIEVIPSGGANLISNGTFESGVTGWVFQGNHNQTSWELGEGFGSQRSLHLRAAGRGDTGANRVRTQLPSTLSGGTLVTLRAKVRWLKGNPNVLLRLRGNWMEAPGYTLKARNLGTPGAANSRAAANIGPAITDVLHWPPLPAASQQVLVTARVQDPDGLSYLALNYRLDPSTNYTALAMTNNGAGVFSAVLPGQGAGTRAAFFIQAADHFPTPASSTFPDDAPARECLVQWGDTSIPGTLPTFRLWISQTNVNRWAGEEKMSNRPKDTTFVYGTNRIVYNAGAWFHGSPYHSPSYDSPVGASCDYDLGFPEDERLLGETDINLFRPGNGGGDGTGQAEIHAYWFGRQFGAPYLYHRPVFVFVNGQRRETIFHDAQQPNGDFVDQWFPDDAEGDLHKIQIGFEFGDLAYGASEPGFSGAGANLANYTTTGGVKKQARYRQTWPRRSSSPLELNDYTNIYVLVNTVLTNAALGSTTYTSALTNAVDVEEWFKIHVTQHLINNGDSFSYGGGQNAFAYKPERDTWKLFLWDVDFAFGGAATDANLTGIGGADHGPRNDHAPFRRIYWQALIEAANGMLTSARSNPILDARYNGMVAGGAGVGSPQGIKDFIAARRTLILSQISANQSPFAITPNGADFSTNRNVAVLTGTAPLEVRILLINGVAYPTTWIAFNTWQVRVPLASGTNLFQITGIDPRGLPVAGVVGTVRVNYTGTTESPRGRVVINEIMYNPVVPDAEFVELYNLSTSNSFDLSRWRLEGLDFTFADGTLLGPASYVVLARDTAAYGLAYGSLAPVIATYEGSLRNDGETLKLIKPGLLPGADEIIDQVSYESLPPWPAAANGLGASLQLIDAAQDNARAANWGVSLTGLKATPGLANSVRTTLTPFPLVWLNEVMPDDSFNSTYNVADGFGDRDPWVELYNGGTNAVSLAGWSLANNFTNLAPWPFPAGATIGPGQFLLVWLDGEPGESSPGELHASFRAEPSVGSVALFRSPNALVDHLNYNLPTASRSYGSVPEGNACGRRIFSVLTPGSSNNPASAPITVFINEWMADNLSSEVDPADGNAEDWFEIFNPGPGTVDLTGYYLTDELTNRIKFPIPAGTLVPGGGYLLIWADGETAQNGPYPQDLHANFSLAKLGEAIGLFAPDGTLIDAVAFGQQITDISQGRFPDGAAAIVSFTNTTPREANTLVLLNGPPVLNPIGARSVNEGSSLMFNASATDPNVPGQILSYSLVAPAPFGATLNPNSGIFNWNPGEAEGPGQYDVTIRVTDNAVPPLSDEETFSIRVNEVNLAPQLSFPNEWVIFAEAPFSLDASGSDPDLPMQQLVYTLEPGAPLGAAIHPDHGQFTWTPPGSALGTNHINVRVTDNGEPASFVLRTLEIVVQSGLRAAIAQEGAQVFITFAASPGHTYRVFYKESLGDAGWTQLGADTIAGSSLLTIPDDLDRNRTQRFYRVEKVD